jgi:putative tryptophan/tyrosine transport system substrate-binding protein
VRRRDFLGIVGSAATALPFGARAQQITGAYRVGILGSDIRNPTTGPGVQMFLAELHKLGFIEGRNLAVDFRRMDEGVAKAHAAANELVAAKIDVLLVSGAEIGLQAAAAARPSVPIVVMANNYDPIARGYVSSLSRPGGNITGLYFRQPELAAKQLELLIEAFPERKRIAVLWDELSAEPFEIVDRRAKEMLQPLRSIKLGNPPHDWDAAFRAVGQEQAELLLVLSSPFFTPHRARLAELAIKYRLPTMFIFRYYVEAGGLMSYGVDPDPVWRRAASYVAKILRGARPADLPMEQVSSFEFSVNLKTARALGVTIPTSILLRATEVIE